MVLFNLSRVMSIVKSLTIFSIINDRSSVLLLIRKFVNYLKDYVELDEGVNKNSSRLKFTTGMTSTTVLKGLP